MTTYVRFTEVNDHEGETWRHWLPVEGNEAALERLATYLETVERRLTVGLPYSLHLDPDDALPETAVDALVKHGGSGYMAYHTKVVGRLTFDHVAHAHTDYEDLDYLFYKGEITKLFTKISEVETETETEISTNPSPNLRDRAVHALAAHLNGAEQQIENHLYLAAAAAVDNVYQDRAGWLQIGIELEDEAPDA